MDGIDAQQGREPVTGDTGGGEKKAAETTDVAEKNLTKVPLETLMKLRQRFGLKKIRF